MPAVVSASLSQFAGYCPFGLDQGVHGHPTATTSMAPA